MMICADFLIFPAADEDGMRACIPAGTYIRFPVAHHVTLSKGDIMCFCEIQDHPRFRLPASTSFMGHVRTVGDIIHPGTRGPEKIQEPVMYFPERTLSHIAKADTALVGDDEHFPSILIELPDSLLDTFKEVEIFGTVHELHPVIEHFIDDAVPIQKYCPMHKRSPFNSYSCILRLP